MDISHDAQLVIRSKFLCWIDGIEEMTAHAQPALIHKELREMAELAHAHGLTPLADMAGAIDKRFDHEADSLAQSIIFNALRDACSCREAPPEMVDAYMAAINQRMYF
jgi:hypothetical protein